MDNITRSEPNDTTVREPVLHAECAVNPLIEVPLPKEDANKYSRGKAVACVGSAAYPGAAILSSWATQVVGAGYSEVFTAPSNKPLLQVRRPSLVVRSFTECVPERLFAKHHPGAVLVGSGLDAADKEAQDLTLHIIQECEKPLVIDGGALTYISKQPCLRALQQRVHKGWPVVITPHQGEAERIARAFRCELTGDQATDALMLNEVTGAVVVLKGPDTLCCDGQRVARVTWGSAALAKAGTGDVLAGAICGLLAQGMEPFDAAVLGVELHALAGNGAAAEVGAVSVCAEDVVAQLPAAICTMLNLIESEKHV